MKGHIRQRGKRSFELKFDPGRDPVTGKREIRYHSFKGTKREAQAELDELIAEAEQGSYVEPNKVSVADFVRARVDQWQAAGDITARTAQRYRQLVENQIVPHIGAKIAAEAHPPRCRGMAHDACEWRTSGPHDRPCAPRAWQGAQGRGRRRPGGQERLQAAEGAQGRRKRNGHRAGRARPSWTRSAASAYTSRPWWHCSPACGWARFWRCAGAASISTAR